MGIEPPIVVLILGLGDSDQYKRLGKRVGLSLVVYSFPGFLRVRVRY
jgi:hypothetical protein